MAAVRSRFSWVQYSSSAFCFSIFSSSITLASFSTELLVALVFLEPCVSYSAAFWCSVLHMHVCHGFYISLLIDWLLSPIFFASLTGSWMLYPQIPSCLNVFLLPLSSKCMIEYYRESPFFLVVSLCKFYPFVENVKNMSGLQMTSFPSWILE